MEIDAPGRLTYSTTVNFDWRRLAEMYESESGRSFGEDYGFGDGVATAPASKDRCAAFGRLEHGESGVTVEALAVILEPLGVS